MSRRARSSDRSRSSCRSPRTSSGWRPTSHSRRRITPQALNLAKKAVSAQSNNYQDHIWLGQVLWIIGQRAATEGRKEEMKSRNVEARNELLRAVQLGRDRPDAWVALIQILVRMDQRGEAEAYLAEAEKALSEADSPLALAQAHEALGNVDRVEPLLRKALDNKPGDVVTIQALANHLIKSEPDEGRRAPAPELDRPPQ